jgi:anti-sigma regulatory factor (Ser/Thr protein kinase)
MREPASNVTIERRLQRKKQKSAILVTDEGIKIDVKCEQKEKDEWQRAQSWQPGSKLTREIVLQLRKQPRSMTSMLVGIVTSSPKPKYRTTDLSSIPIKNGPQMRKKRLFRSTTIVSISDVASESPVSCERCSGIQIDFSDEQPRNAKSPRIESREPTSNVTLERFAHPEKQRTEMISTDEGRQIDCSDKQ